MPTTISSAWRIRPSKRALARVERAAWIAAVPALLVASAGSPPSLAVSAALAVIVWGSAWSSRRAADRAWAAWEAERMSYDHDGLDDAGAEASAASILASPDLRVRIESEGASRRDGFIPDEFQELAEDAREQAEAHASALLALGIGSALAAAIVAAPAAGGVLLALAALGVARAVSDGRGLRRDADLAKVRALSRMLGRDLAVDGILAAPGDAEDAVRKALVGGEDAHFDGCSEHGPVRISVVPEGRACLSVEVVA